MNPVRIFFKHIFCIIILLNLQNISLKADEKINAIADQIQIILQEIKTLEKAVYKKSDIISSNMTQSGSLNEDVLTKHLLKLNAIEDQFRELTNKFEEVSFKMDKLSGRVTKIQSDTQLRFSDLEDSENINKNSKKLTKKKLPGTSEAQDFGSTPGYETSELPNKQEITSVETVGTVFTDKPEKTKSLLPNKPPEDQYTFAVSFIKIGDYETAEFALKEFIETNKDHDLAGNAQFWYGETFRIRQLYSDAATAYLDGYQNYPKSKKAPDNLLKLGITMVELGEKDQGCNMIAGIKKQYPKASKSVLQKALYEQKRFKCAKS